MKINYKESGKGKTILLIHGFSGDLYYWKPLESVLKDHHTIIIDLPGHGQSEKLKHPISIDEIVDEIYYFLKEKNINKVTLIGFSLGSIISLKLALKYSDIVTNLILFSCQVRPVGIMNSLFIKIKNDLEECDYLKGFLDLLPYVLTDDVIEQNKAKLKKSAENKAKTADIKSLCYVIDAGLDIDIFNRINEITVPVLLFSGKQDEITTLNSVKLVHNNLKQSKLIIFNNTKHNIIISNNLPIIKKEVQCFLKE